MINQVIQAVLVKHCQIICNNVVSRWNSQLGIEGNAEIYVVTPELSSAVTGLVSISLEASGMKAWIAEFGSGSLMDKENPYLNAYRVNPNYNPVRLSDGSITGRPEGIYYDLDGAQHYSSGSAKGQDLELKPVYPVMYPQHIIQFEIDSEIPSIIADLQTTVAEYMVSQLTMDINIYI